MAVPDNPTREGIVNEALNRSGYPNPTGSMILRAYDWMEETKADIAARNKKFKSLLAEDYVVLQKGVTDYSNPSDYGFDMVAKLLTGNHYGTSQATLSTVSAIQFASTEDVGTGCIGWYVLMTGATAGGALFTASTRRGECRQITAYNTSTKVASVTPDFSAAPDATSTYMIIDYMKPLTVDTVSNFDGENALVSLGEPSHIIHQGGSTIGKFKTYRTPDKTPSGTSDGYGVLLRYYADLQQIDLTEGATTLITTLYRRWRHIWYQGIYVRALQSLDDRRYPAEWTKYQVMITQLIGSESYYSDMSNLQITTGE